MRRTSWAEYMSVLAVWLTTLIISDCLADVDSVRVSVPADIIELLQDPKRYNRHASPTQIYDTPTVVSIQMYIEGISSFRAETMDFNVDIYFQERWTDTRLRHNDTRRVLIKDPKLFELMWHPDLYFANARTSSFHEVTSPNFLVWIYANGTSANGEVRVAAEEGTTLIHRVLKNRTEIIEPTPKRRTCFSELPTPTTPDQSMAPMITVNDDPRISPQESSRSGSGGGPDQSQQKWTSSVRKLQMLRKWKNRKMAQRIDRYSRICFPLTFIVFNIVYWIYYVYIA
uniref:Neurotransmitter-gated ion-channel ligand-binding domain-containing protein n=1 Tax=Plectus sambesii TaxID=2011161 RepID=A0A914WSG8_9BILA